MLALGLLKETGPTDENYGELARDYLMIVILTKGFMHWLVLHEHRVSILMNQNQIFMWDK